MGGPDYCRYHTDLMAHGEAEFPDQNTMLGFVAKIVAEDYKSFILRLMVSYADTAEDFDRYLQREDSEPMLVEIYVKSYIKRKLAENNTIGNKLKAKWHHLSWPLDIRFDAEDHTEMYAFVLEKIGQGDTVEDVFTSGYAYTIVEGQKLRRAAI